MSCKQCKKIDRRLWIDAIFFTALGIGLIGGAIGMLITWHFSWDGWHDENSMNWLQFIICAVATLPGIVTAVYINLPYSDEEKELCS